MTVPKMPQLMYTGTHIYLYYKWIVHCTARLPLQAQFMYTGTYALQLSRNLQPKRQIQICVHILYEHRLMSTLQNVNLIGLGELLVMTLAERAC